MSKIKFDCRKRLLEAYDVIAQLLGLYEVKKGKK